MGFQSKKLTPGVGSSTVLSLGHEVFFRWVCGGKVGVSWWVPQAQVEKNMFGVMSSWKIQTGNPTLSNDRSRWCICEGQALCMLGSPRPKNVFFDMYMILVLAGILGVHTHN